MFFFLFIRLLIILLSEIHIHTYIIICIINKWNLKGLSPHGERERERERERLLFHPFLSKESGRVNGREGFESINEDEITENVRANSLGSSLGGLDSRFSLGGKRGPCFNASFPSMLILIHNELGKCCRQFPSY